MIVFFTEYIKSAQHVLGSVRVLRRLSGAVVVQTSLFPATFPSSLCGIRTHSQTRLDIKSLQRVLGLPRGLLPVGCAQKTSKGRRSGGSWSNGEPLRLDPFVMKEQQLYSELSPNVWTPYSISKAEPGIFITADTAPINPSISRSILPSPVDNTPRYLTPSLGATTHPQPGGSNPPFSTMASHLEVLTPNWRHWTPSHAEPALPILCDGASQLPPLHSATSCIMDRLNSNLMSKNQRLLWSKLTEIQNHILCPWFTIIQCHLLILHAWKMMSSLLTPNV